MEGIYVDSLHKTFRGRALRFLGVSVPLLREKAITALNGISLSVQAGESVGVIGPNGAGKTTLMGCLLGFIYPDSGKVEIDGGDPNSMKVRKLIGYVPERLNFHEYFTIEEFLKFHYQLAGLAPKLQNSRVEELLLLVGLERAKWKLPVGKCSRGMLQRLAIARAMMPEPKYLFLDEPTSGIDPCGVLEITTLLTEVRKTGVTLILNSHQLDQVQRICQRMVFVQHGRTVNTDLLEQNNSTVRSITLRFSKMLDRHSSDVLEQITRDLSLSLQSIWNDTAEIIIETDDDNVRLLKAVIAHNLPLLEAVPKHSRLERLFLGARGSSLAEGVKCEL